MKRLSSMVSAAAVAGLVLTGLTPAADAATTGPAPGPVGPRGLLQDTTQLYGYDVVVDQDGVGYVAWISDDSASAPATRKVRVCVLPKGSTSCAGGVQVIDALGPSSAAGLKLLTIGSGAAVVWFHDTTPGSVFGPRGGRIATASITNGVLSGPTDSLGDAPSFGSLLDAQVAPDGAVWTVAYKGVGTSSVEVRNGASGVTDTVTTPYSVGKAELAFAGGTPVLAITEYGSVSTPISTAYRSAAGWSGFTAVANTWSVGTLGLAAAGGSVHLVAAIGNASYVPVVSHFTGSAFTTPRKTGDRSSCAPSSHDLVSDASGRLADVSNECGKITVANQAQRSRAGLVRFGAGGTVAGGDPQVGTSPRGFGWVAWSTQSTIGNKLQVTRLRLPALVVHKGKRSSAALVKVTGPASCLPPVRATVGAKAKGRNGWQVASTALRLDGDGYGKSSIDGSRLKAGSSHTLVARAVLTKGGSSVTRTSRLSFRACPNP